MKAVQVLERKEVIRWFGVALIIAPIVNTYFNIGQRGLGYSFYAFQFTLKTTSVHNLVLYGLSILIGAWMLKGRTSSWRHVLFLLGSYILIQLPQLAQNIKANKLMGVFFLVNVFVFYFIADQLVWKIKVSPKNKPTPKPAPVPATAKIEVPVTAVVRPQAVARKVPLLHTSRQKILLSFEGFGPWAELKNISSRGIELKSLKELPFQMKDRVLELSLAPQLAVQLRLSKIEEKNYRFDFVEMNEMKIRQINQWLKKIETKSAENAA